MPRRSAEERGAALYRVGGRPPVPPDYLSDAAKAVWRTIVADRPADYFRPSNYDLLASYCSLLVTARELFRRMESLDQDTQYASFGIAVAQAAKLSAALTGFAAKLRLTPSAEIDRKSRKLDERGMLEDDPTLFGAEYWEARDKRRLLGGHAAHGAKANVVKIKGTKRRPPLDAPPL
jgi:phage terminase small subunit